MANVNLTKHDNRTSVNVSKGATAATVLGAAEDAINAASAAEVSKLATDANVVLTNADVVSTNSDVVLTNADVVSTNADAVQTALDVISTNADVVSTNADATQTALDVIATNADVVTTNANASQTAFDVIATNADVILTNADVVTTGTNATNAQLRAWEAEAEKMTADSYATEAEDVFVNTWTSDGDGTFTSTPTTEYSSLHYSAKADATVTPFTTHLTDETNPHVVTQAQVGLGNVDNTSDANKPVSTPQQTALDLKLNSADLIKATGNINNPLLDLPLNNSLAMKQGVGSVTFARSTTATYIDRYGVLKTASIDEPRFEKDGLLIEGASTNIIPYSTDFTTWIVDGTTTWSYIEAAPDGSNTAVAKTNTNPGALSRSLVSFVSGVEYTFSVWLKKKTTNTIDIQTWSNNGNANIFPITVTDEWARYEIQFTADFTESGYAYVIGGTTDGYAFAPQIEALPFASSYIPTTTTAVTRGADVCTVDNYNNMPNTNTINSSLAVALDYSTLGSTGLSQALIGQYANSANYWYIRRYQVDTRSAYYTEADNVTTAGITVFDANALYSDTKRVLLNIDGQTQSLYENGILHDTDIRTTDTMTNDLSSKPITIGSLIEGTSAFTYGHIKNIRIWDKALTPTEAQIA